MVTRAQQARGSGRAPGWKRWSPWLGGLVLAAGVAYAIVAFFPDHHASASASQPQGTTPVTTAPAPKKVPLSKDAEAIARRFLQTAVARTNLDEAWKISDENVRGGLTHEEWMTGNIPVVPYPIESLAVARFKIDYSYADEALLEIALLPKDGAQIKPQTFFLGLKRVPGPDGTRHWVVDDWVPRASTLVPTPGD